MADDFEGVPCVECGRMHSGVAVDDSPTSYCEACLPPSMSYEDAVRYGRGVGIDTDRLDFLQSVLDGSSEFTVTLPDGRVVMLGFHWTINRGNAPRGAVALALPPLRELADAGRTLVNRESKE